MGRVLIRRACARAIALALAALAAQAARATDWELSFDGRLLNSDGTRSFVDGGLGALRFGEDQSGVALGRARFAIDQSIGQILALRIDASAWGDHDKNPVDLTEAYLEVRPFPIAGFRPRVKAGAFYAPISLENRSAGWESPYTLSSSALNSWVAEELRTIGLEASLEWLGTRLGHDFDLGLTGAVYGWNEPAGVSLATHGFSINDRQTTLFGRIGKPGVQPVHGFEVFREIDGRAGTYVGVEARYLDRVTLRALHYNNNADPEAFDPVLKMHAWQTCFDTAGLRAESESGWTAIFQWMQGETYVAPAGVGELEWDFRTRYLLLSKRTGKHTLSARYDEFTVAPQPPARTGSQTGHATTVAYRYDLSARWRFTLEWVQVRSGQSSRVIYYGEAPFVTENLLQLAVRWSIGSTH
jgi:hypothetical protein